MKIEYNKPNLPDDVKIIAKRIAIVPITAHDDHGIFLLRKDPVVNKYIDRKNIESLDEAQDFVKTLLEKATNSRLLYWTIRLLENDGMIGTICLWNFSKDQKTAELGYELLSAYHRQGFMTEAVEAVVNWAFNQGNFTTIEAFTHRENMSSINLLKTKGFTLISNRIDVNFPNNIIFSKTTEKAKKLI